MYQQKGVLVLQRGSKENVQEGFVYDGFTIYGLVLNISAV